VPWLAAGGIAIVASALVLLVRPDPKRIAELLATDERGADAAPAAPLSEILRRPGVRPALLAAVGIGHGEETVVEAQPPADPGISLR